MTSRSNGSVNVRIVGRDRYGRQIVNMSNKDGSINQRMRSKGYVDKGRWKYEWYAQATFWGTILLTGGTSFYGFFIAKPIDWGIGLGALAFLIFLAWLSIKLSDNLKKK